ncbi:integrin alpha-D-like [Thamnophis elegans]|uniref:integrin alpha-D-like n=1 Tax=Thamnophis elegans TaxID=35005 RepID=UPI00137739C2|nr:integrin alpha-D-like [Thamnophis elegans]
MESLQLFFCFSAVAVLTPCHGFSVDTEQPVIFRERVKSFGYSVVQFGSGTNGGVLVGAPLQQGGVNETGNLYKCQGTSSKTGGCQEMDLQRPADAVNMSLGLSVSAHDSQVLVCGPRVHQTCGEYIYLKGYCFLLDQNLRQIQRFPDKLPECARRPADIVFLIDGSGSINTRQFSQMKTFISEVIKRFQNTNTQFGLSQYSRSYEEHFDFLLFKTTPNPDDLIKTIWQLHGATYTATYIQRVVREMFLPEKGARSDASKVLIVITDGEKSGDPLEYSDVIPEAQRANIIRFAIGVGRAFSRGTARQELMTIASEPSMNYVFAVNNFDALKDIQNSLQSKIFAIEGTQSQNTRNSSQSFELELSQEGFSALHTQSGTLLGAVGAYDWAGGVFLFNSQDDATFINISSSISDLKSAYLGYSIQEVRLNGQSSFVVGAPRYQHVGKVVWFSQRRRQWKQKSELSLGQSPQIGSYFGASLCAVDLNRDGNTDLILIGAPMYYDGIAGGKVYVCKRRGETFSCNVELQGEPHHPLGRFGTSITEAGEITGDRWTDVAVGAPLEDENQGAVYIFQGTSSSLNPVFSQRIPASTFANRLQYFGQAIDGGSEITGDGLPDLAVGADGQVLLLRARPVVNVVVGITFNPTMIPISAFECGGQQMLNKEISTATVNFKIQEDSRFTFGSDILSTIRYTLTLDPGRQKVRAVFNQGSELSTLTEEMKIRVRPESRQYRIKLPTCIEDSLTPIILQLNYTLIGEPIQRANNVRAILQKDAPVLIPASLPFEKNCGKDGICKDQLKTSFNFSGLNELVVGLTLELNVTVFLRNDGEDSYSTNLTFIYPSSLSYRRYILVQSNRKYVVIKCTPFPAIEGSVRNTTCGINQPIFRSMAEVIFIVSFFVSQDANLGSKVQISATATSENTVTVTKDTFHQMELPVKYAIYVFINSLDESTKYVDFSAGQEDEIRTVEHRYELKNTYHRNASVSVTFHIPVSLNGIQIWNPVLDVPKEFPQIICAPETITPGSKEFVKQLRKQPVLNCSVATCKTITCNVSSLERHQPIEFMIKGNIGLKWLSQTQQKKVTLGSSAQVSYDESKYKQKEGFVWVQAATIVEFLEPYNYLPIIIGSSVGGLVLLVLIIAGLYKLGFFKRQYKQMIEAADNEVAESPPETSTPSDATKG